MPGVDRLEGAVLGLEAHPPVLAVERLDGRLVGRLVVALAGSDESADEATVKTFYREQGRIRLQPENSALEPIYADYVQILGCVVGVFREL